MKYAVFISFYLLVSCLIQKQLSEKRLDKVLQSMHLKFQRVQCMISLDQQIAAINNRLVEPISYDEFLHIMGRNNINWDDAYEDLELKIRYETGKVRYPCIMTFDKFIFRKDTMNQKIYFGTETNLAPYIPMEIFINKQKVRRRYDNIYVIPYSENIKIRYQLYKADKCGNMIDTVRYERNINSVDLETDAQILMP